MNNEQQQIEENDADLERNDFDQQTLEELASIERVSARFITVSEYIQPYPDRITRCFGVFPAKHIEVALDYKNNGVETQSKKQPDSYGRRFGFQVSPLFDSVQKFCEHLKCEANNLAFEINNYLFRSESHAAGVLEKMNVISDILHALDEEEFTAQDLRRAVQGIRFNKAHDAERLAYFEQQLQAGEQTNEPEAE